MIKARPVIHDHDSFNEGLRGASGKEDMSGAAARHDPKHGEPVTSEAALAGDKPSTGPATH
jgi:hypothetical protein